MLSQLPSDSQPQKFVDTIDPAAEEVAQRRRIIKPADLPTPTQRPLLSADAMDEIMHEMYLSPKARMHNVIHEAVVNRANLTPPPYAVNFIQYRANKERGEIAMRWAKALTASTPDTEPDDIQNVELAEIIPLIPRVMSTSQIKEWITARAEYNDKYDGHTALVEDILDKVEAIAMLTKGDCDIQYSEILKLADINTPYIWRLSDTQLLALDKAVSLRYNAKLAQHDLGDDGKSRRLGAVS